MTYLICYPQLVDHSITLDEIVQNYMPYIPLYLIENEDEIKQAFPDRVTDDEYIP